MARDAQLLLNTVDCGCVFKLTYLANRGCGSAGCSRVQVGSSAGAAGAAGMQAAALRHSGAPPYHMMHQHDSRVALSACTSCATPGH